MSDDINQIQPEFALHVHEFITRAGVGDSLPEVQLQAIIAANLSQDLRQFESEVHFDNCAFQEGIEHINAEWTRIEMEANRLSDRAIVSFGRLLHTIQDFYSHSNWIELHSQKAPIPLWDSDIGSLPADIVSGTWTLGKPKMCRQGAPSHEQLNKDTIDTIEGGKIVSTGPNSGKSYYQLAEDAAVRETRKQVVRLVRELLPPLPEVMIVNEQPLTSRELRLRKTLEATKWLSN